MKNGSWHQHGTAAVEPENKLVKTASPHSLPQLFRVPSKIHEGLIDVQRIVENVRLMAKEKGIKVIGIASAVSNEGTSTLAAVIPLIMAENANGTVTSFTDDESKSKVKNDLHNSRRHKILLIDAQWRHPSMHDFLNQPMERGLGEILNDEIMLQDAIKEISGSDLSLITLGQKDWNPLAPFDFEKFGALLSKIKSHFEFVFLDIPPILRFAEGISMSKQCDGLILVVRARQTRWEVVAEAKRLLENSGVNILGAVLNRRKFYIPEGIYRRL